MADNFSTSAARLAGLVPLILGWTLASLFRSLEGHAIGGDPALPLDQSTFAILKEAFPDG